MSSRPLGSIVSNTSTPPGLKVLEEEVGVIMSAPSGKFRLFLRVPKKSWPGSIAIVPCLLGLLIVGTQVSAFAPCIHMFI